MLVVFTLCVVVFSTAILAAEVSKAGRVNHIVIAWLKYPANPQSKQKFIEVTKSFADLPGVIDHSVGVVLPSSRKVVDSSFDVATVITFKDRVALNNYLNHPKHKKAVESLLKPLVRKIVVYDIDLK